MEFKVLRRHPSPTGSQASHGRRDTAHPPPLRQGSTSRKGGKKTPGHDARQTARRFSSWRRKQPIPGRLRRRPASEPGEALAEPATPSSNLNGCRGANRDAPAEAGQSQRRRRGRRAGGAWPRPPRALHRDLSRRGWRPGYLSFRRPGGGARLSQIPRSCRQVTPGRSQRPAG